MSLRRPSVLRWLLLLPAVGLLQAAAPVLPLPDDPRASDQDRAYMKRANELAALTASKGNSSYGALLVKDGVVLMEFGNDARTSGDITHHAETGLISKATRELGREAVAGAVLYTSTEPCIMCCGSIRWANLKKFVYGATALQVSKQRGGPLPEHPLQCREVFERIGAGDVAIIGPVSESAGLAVHAAAARAAGAAK